MPKRDKSYTLIYNGDVLTGRTFFVSRKNFTRISQLDGRKGSRAKTNMVRHYCFYSRVLIQTQTVFTHINYYIRVVCLV